MSDVGAGASASDFALMFPHSSPLVTEANETKARSRCSAGTCPGVAAVVSVGALVAPTDPLSFTFDPLSWTGPPPKTKVMFILPGPAMRFFDEMLALSCKRGSRFASQFEALDAYHPSRSLVPA